MLWQKAVCGNQGENMKKKTGYQITARIFELNYVLWNAEYKLPKFITANISQPFPQEVHIFSSDLVSKGPAIEVNGGRSVG